MKTAKIANFYQDKPLFGLDIGHGSLKVMQLSEPGPSLAGKNHQNKVVGYGFTTFDKAAQKDGVVVQPEIIAKAAHELFKNGLLGEINTRRTAIAIPAYRTFTRSIQLPKLEASELRQAVELETEQYISLPLDQLYLDYEIISEDDTSVNLFMVAVPRIIVDSYLDLSQVLGLETILIEPTLSASGRLLSIDGQNDDPSFMIDFGSLSCDISIFDKHVVVTGTVQGGGVNFTQSIKEALHVSDEEAGIIKTRYGLGRSKKQDEIRKAMEPTLQQIIKEIRRMMRYYEERYGPERPISQVVTLGGGANMPGLSDYLTDNLRMAVRHSDPWQYIDHKSVKLPTEADRPMYSTVAGLALANHKSVFIV